MCEESIRHELCLRKNKRHMIGVVESEFLHKIWANARIIAVKTLYINHQVENISNPMCNMHAHRLTRRLVVLVQSDLIVSGGEQHADIEGHDTGGGGGVLELMPVSTTSFLRG
ncbi:hypothetical protein Pfo_020877 [Paulownia fortunei]|nr:hypothetical protein Pfo_020877 [Paulownia fortunei]